MTVHIEYESLIMTFLSEPRFICDTTNDEEYFQAPTLKLFIHYGYFLPYPIYFSDGKSKILINNEKPFDFQGTES